MNYSIRRAQKGKMYPKFSKISVCLVALISTLTTWLFAHLYQNLLSVYEKSGKLVEMEYSWAVRLLLNLAGYTTVLLPGFTLYMYLEKCRYFDLIPRGGCLSHILFACVGESHERVREIVRPVKIKDSRTREGVELVFCFAGLTGSYLFWWLLQEKIMTQNYLMPDGSIVKFDDCQLLIFINRLLAFGIALGRLLYINKQLVAAPLFKFSYCSVTNLVSAWCQYEALKYISYPNQVASKSCKVILVMLMSKLVSRNKYELYEYVTAVLISFGMIFFVYGSHENYVVSTMTTMSQLTLLALYMLCDSFTSSWQGALFNQYNLAPSQMLIGVNLFSCLLTAAALLHHSSTINSIAMLQHPLFASNCFLLSVSSAVSQLLIYHTIARFGAVVFTIIITLRQAVSVLFSCLVYGHYISVGAAFGVFLVFSAVLLRIYCRQ